MALIRNNKNKEKNEDFDFDALLALGIFQPQKQKNNENDNDNRIISMNDIKEFNRFAIEECFKNELLTGIS